jgi:hypothetical protein
MTDQFRPTRDISPIPPPGLASDYCTASPLPALEDAQVGTNFEGTPNHTCPEAKFLKAREHVGALIVGSERTAGPAEDDVSTSKTNTLRPTPGAHSRRNTRWDEETIPVPITNDDRRPVHDAIINDFLNLQRGSSLRWATMRMVERGRQSAFIAPIVDYAVNGALETCTLPSVWSRMPAEVDDRKAIAAHEAAKLVEGGMGEPPLFVDAYLADPVLLQGMTDPDRVSLLYDRKFLQSQCESPFSEATFWAPERCKPWSVKGWVIRMYAILLLVAEDCSYLQACPKGNHKGN